jgi:hypothetical protein
MRKRERKEWRGTRENEWKEASAKIGEQRTVGQVNSMFCA